MTIEDLYYKCDLINFYTKMFVIDSDQVIKAWNTPYGDLSCAIATTIIDHFVLVGDNEVIVLVGDNEVIVWIP